MSDKASFISAEARGKRRLLHKQIANEWRSATGRDIPKYAEAYATKKSGVGKKRALAALCRAFGSGAQLQEANPKYAVWARLDSFPDELKFDPEHPGRHQACIMIEFIALGILPSDPDALQVRVGGWSVEFTDHALGRLFDRTPRCNPIEIMYEAHKTILEGSPLIAYEMAKEGRSKGMFALPLSQGVFRCELIRISEQDDQVFARALTWIDKDDGNPTGGLPVLTKGDPGKRFGDTVMMPYLLRPKRRSTIHRAVAENHAPIM